MRAVVVVRTIRQVLVDVVVGVRVVERPGKRVVPEQRVAAREPLLGLELHRVVVVAGVAAVVAEVLAPAELLEVRLALVGGQRAEPFDAGLVEIVVAAEAGEHVRALVADVGSLDRHVARQLMLHRQVPGVVGGQPQFLGKDQRRHAVGQQRAAVRSARLVLQDRRRVQRGGPCARLNTESKLRAGCSDWMASTGRFWVTLWPKTEPKTPVS